MENALRKSRIIPPAPSVTRPGLEIRSDLSRDGTDLRDMGEDPVADEDDVGQDEDDEDRGEHRHGFLDAAEVQDDEENDGADIEGDLIGLKRRGKETEDAPSPQETIETVIVSM